MVKLQLIDEEYPFKGFTHERDVARGVVIFDDGRIAIHTVFRDDIFCKQRYFETPGGGVDEGETNEEAVIRECEEELGYRVEVIKEIGEVDDAYNLIGRKNHNHYYLCRAKEEVGKHFESLGDGFIVETKLYSLEEAIELFKQMPDDLVSGLVKRRELPILIEAKRILSEML